MYIVQATLPKTSLFPICHMAVLNSFLQVFIVLGTYNFVSISTTTWQGASDELSMILLYAFGKMYISSLSCKSTMYYWWIISSASVSPHSSIVVNFSVFPAILQGPPRQSGFLITSLLIDHLQYNMLGLWVDCLIDQASHLLTPSNGGKWELT